MALVNLFNESSLYSNRSTRRHLSRGRKHPQDKHFESRHLSDPSQASALYEPLEPRLLLSADLLWVQQFGNSTYDHAQDVAVDGSGNAYVTGYTDGDLNGSNAGGRDGFLTKFDSDGNKIWGKQLGTSDYDFAYGVAADGSGNAYVTGATRGDLEGTNAGTYDVFLTKFDSDGNKVWGTQFGTSYQDYAYDVAVDGSGNAYVTGYTTGDLEGTNEGVYDVYLTKFDSDGNRQWVTQFGTSSSDYAYGVAVDGSGNAYVTGQTMGDLEGTNAGGYDAFLTKFDSDGNKVWGKQFGTSEHEYGRGVAVDGSGNAYVTGRTTGDLEGTNAGGFDVFLTKFDSDRNYVWGKQFGASGDDEGRGVAVDGSGNAYVTGRTEIDLEGANKGNKDAFLTKFDSDGNEVWGTQFGTSESEEALGVAVDGSGNAYVAGETEGDLEGTNAGGTDAFLAKVGKPESCTTIDDLRAQVQSLNTKASVKRSLGKLLSSVAKQLDKGKNPGGMSKLIGRLVGYSSDPDHKKYVPVDEANTLILASANYLSCLNGQPCTFTSTNFDDLRGVIHNLTTSNKTKNKLNKLLSKIEGNGPTVQIDYSERVGLTKVISILVGKSTKLNIQPGEAHDLICQVANVMTQD